MNSFNHYAYGSVCEAIYSRIAGLKNLSPGWKKVVIQPHLNYRLKKIKFSYDSISGKYEISWKYDEYKFYLNVSIPNGAMATIILPNNTEFSVGEGDYKFESDMNEKIIAPFSIDTPLFELLENEDANKLIRELLPSVYHSATGENSEMLYNTIRQLGNRPFSGITQDTINKCQKELAKIKVLNYTSPDVTPSDDTPSDIPSDITTDTTDGKKSEASLLIYNLLLLCLIILFYI